jgi:hypothetical protein
MRQSSQISKLTGFLAISLILGLSLSIGAKAEEPAPAAQATPRNQLLIQLLARPFITVVMPLVA